MITVTRWRGGGLVGSVAAEWTKLWTVRSTWVCLASSAGLMVAYTVIAGAARRGGGSGPTAHSGPMDVAGTGVVFMAQFAVLTLASLVIASEYATTSIRSTLQGVPVRWRVLVGKAAVLAPVLFVLGVLLGLLGFATASLALGPDAAATTAGEVILRSVGIGGYLGLASVVVLGVGAVVRSVAGTVVVSFLLLLILPMVLGATPVPVLQAVANYLPGPAGMELMGVAEVHAYGKAAALALLLAWGVVSLGVGQIVLRTRDA